MNFPASHNIFLGFFTLLKLTSVLDARAKPITLIHFGWWCPEMMRNFHIFPCFNKIIIISLFSERKLWARWRYLSSQEMNEGNEKEITLKWTRETRPFSVWVEKSVSQVVMMMMRRGWIDTREIKRVKSAISSSANYDDESVMSNKKSNETRYVNCDKSVGGERAGN